ncbi:MAG TPA: condensation domain-containing protein [Methanospirillum sp.]|uniref:condensation domain-containing protein n=1 Tax=Methanospirillum sp. TaxID=45200 RepID=UPI002CB86A38|nr:condensation domain-containing protein [Methanospirillum sp.]HWQ63941.1 condensation domain-containing protein [Methanospirillum sp.]
MIHLVIMLKGQIHSDSLVKAAMMATEAEPIIRCRLVQDDNKLLWEMIPEIKSEELFIQISDSNPVTLLQKALSYQIDPYQGPMIRIIHIRSTEDKGDILVINAHHASMDGKGMKDFASLLFSFYRGERSGCAFHTEPGSISQRILPQISSRITRQENLNPDGVSWSDKFSIPAKSMHCEQQVFSILSLNRERVRIIHEVRKEWKVTLNDLMLAAVATVCAGLTQWKLRDIHLLTTIDLRRYLKEVPQRTVFNYSTAFEVSIPVFHDDSLMETSLKVHMIMDEIKQKNPGIDGAIEAEHLYNAGCVKARTDMQKQWNEVRTKGKRSPLFTNTGIINPKDLDPGVSVSRAFLLPTHNLPPGFSFAISSFGDVMTLSSSYGLPAFDPDMVRALYSSLDMIIPGYDSDPGTYMVI